MCECNQQYERIFNHALYHLVYHWAAYIATLVLLVTLGMITSITQDLPAKAYFYIFFANIFGFIGTIVYLLRMNSFAKIVVDGIGQPAADDTGWKIRGKVILKHPGSLWFAFSVSAVLFIVNLIILLI